MSERVLFVSGRCEHSKKVLIGISQYEFLKGLFKTVNVDTQPFPNYIKSVPSILINGQVITGDTVFEYLGKLVEGKKEQDNRIQNQTTTEKDEGQCRINEDGELEGWCSSGIGVEYSMITDDNDDFTKKIYKMDSNLSFLDGVSESTDNNLLGQQIKDMENNDNKLNEKRKQFDNEYERLQKERNQLGNGMMRQ